LKNFRVSVVIATIGNKSVLETISSLNEGTLVPNEIILCLPPGVKFDQYPLPKNVRVLNSKKKGQVSQRLFAFKRVKNDLVLQLDDDLILENECLYHLVKYLEKKELCSVGPQIFDINTKKYSSFLEPKSINNVFFRKIIFYIINGAQGYIPGGIGLSGINMGVPGDGKNYQGINWLPGCCVLHKKDSLVLEDYYPYEGKAYIEDIIHSKLLNKKNISMDRCGNANIFVKLTSNNNSIISHIIESFKYLRVMNWFTDKYDGNRFRIILFFLLYRLLLVLIKINK
jgi:hypothetical protein